MCKIYNTIGCLTTIKAHLHKNNIYEYHSINELIFFRKNYDTTRQKIISNHHFLIEHERNLLSAEVAQLDDSIRTRKNEVKQQQMLNIETLKYQMENLIVTDANVIQVFIGYAKRIELKLQIQFNELISNFRIERAIKRLIQDHHKKNIRYQFIVSNPEDAVLQSGSSELQELVRKKNVIDQIKHSIYGALGEQKVVNELKKLSDDCIVINDFTCQFHPAIYNQKENDYIQSVQIDHILIMRSGVFLIETKNWSRNSVNNPNFYSPVQQIKRANLALYRILNGEFSVAESILKKSSWGDRKVPIRNLIVMINNKPIEEFQYVKILTLNGLLNYVNYFQPCFSNAETEMIAAYLLDISENN
ncbi:MAG TPA: NERD domain-containing protein [Mucilaginibacter sp.]